MKLTLRFRGDLPSNGGPEEKHAIRLQLHSQLEAYWQKDSRLKDISKNLKGLQVPTLKSSRFEVTRPIKGRRIFLAASLMRTQLCTARHRRARIALSSELALLQKNRR
jgi:hypothetical protein